jgi:hypothetical protein
MSLDFGWIVLKRQLCWTIDTLVFKNPTMSLAEAKSIPYRAPPWSWVSMNRPVSWRHYCSSDITANPPEYSFLIQIMDIALVAIGDDLLAQLQDAKLEIICGPLISRTSITPLINGRSFLPRTTVCLLSKAMENYIMIGIKIRVM